MPYDQDGILIVPVPRAGNITYTAYDSDAASLESGLDCTGDQGFTQQQFKEECDINEIVRRFGLTGQLPDNVRVPVSGDFTGITDFHSAMNAVRKAEESFMELPADLRYKFNNDPQRLMEFVADENNKPEAEKLGLINKPPERTRDAVMAIDELRTVLTPTQPTK